MIDDTSIASFQNPYCNVCPVPYEVRCNPFGGMTDKSIIGECSNNRDGLIYACHDKEKCVDTNVQTLCTKGGIKE